jgi:hypothetical protein
MNFLGPKLNSVLLHIHIEYIMMSVEIVRRDGSRKR